MKKRRWASHAGGYPQIDSYMEPEQMAGLRHPEARGPTPAPTRRGSRIVSMFDKTPPDIACGRFWELRWAYGCPLDCSYCYLRGTMRGRMAPKPVRTDHVLAAIDEALAEAREPAIFNTGELSDSLMYPRLMEAIVDRFEEQSAHKVALLSKLGRKNAAFLLERARKQTICAWSVNADPVARRWEAHAAPPRERIDCARAASEAGYDTRIRLDPMFPVYDWKRAYGEIVDYVLSSLTPNRIVLGTPRGLWKTIKYARDAGADMEWANFLGEDSSWGKKLALEQRRGMYEFIVDRLASAGYDLSRVSLCKETVGMREAAGLGRGPPGCGCYGEGAYRP